MNDINQANFFISKLNKTHDLELQEKYLNSRKWTNIIILILSQLDDEIQVLRIIRLGLEVDLILGATLVSPVREKFKDKAIDLILHLNISETLLIELLTLIKNQAAVTSLEDILHQSIDRGSNSYYDAQNISKIITFIKDIDENSFFIRFNKFLENEDVGIQEIVLEALANSNLESLNKFLSDRECTKDLLKQKTESYDISFRALAFKNLIKLNDPWAITELKNDYNREPCVYLDRWNIIEIFSTSEAKLFVDCFIFGLFESNRGCHFQAIEALRIRKDIKEDFKIDLLLHGLCQKLEDEIDSSVLNRSIGEALNNINPDVSIEKLTLMMQCDDVEVRVNALSALREFKDESVFKIAIQALKDKSDKVVIEALRTIYSYYQRNSKKTENTLSINLLATCLQSNNSAIFKWTCHLIYPNLQYTIDLESFSEVKGKELIYPLFLKRTQDSNLEICLESIYILGFFDHAEIKNKLRQLIENCEPKIKAYAIYALGKIGDKSDINRLLKKLKHPEAIVREGAVNGLRLMRNKLAKQPLIEILQDKNIDVQISAIKALAAICGEDIEEYLIALVKNTDDYKIADITVFVLGTIGTTKTVECLKYFLKNIFNVKKREDLQNLPDIETVIQALERIGSNLAIRTLLDIVPRDSHIDCFVENALARLGGLEIIPRLWEIQHKSKATGFLDTIASIQKSYGYYNPNYCQVTPQNLNLNKINLQKNDYEEIIELDYSPLSDYRWY